MDSLKQKSKYGYTPIPCPEVDDKQVEPGFLQSSAPYMPLNDKELGDRLEAQPSYPVLKAPQFTFRGREPLPEPVQAQPQPQINTEPVEDYEDGKKRLMAVVKVMKVLFLFKIVGLILAGIYLLGENPIAPGSIFCMIFLTFALIFFGINIKLGKKAAKKMRVRFIGRKLKYIIFNYCCYWMLMVIA